MNYENSRFARVNSLAKWWNSPAFRDIMQMSADEIKNEVNKMNFNFGNNLKRLRLAKNYTQEQAAEKLNVSSKAISRWECGNAMPDVMLLPEIARLYCVTVDELYKEKSIAYENYAHKLMSVYESTHNQKDFIEADREFTELIRSGNYTMNDVCIYAILYQFHMQYCRDKALELFKKGLDMGEDNDPHTYHWIERQRMALLSGIGEDDKNIEDCKNAFDANPDNVYSHINLLFAYFLADENEKALKIFEKAEKKFGDSAILYVHGGDIYRRLKIYDKAFKCWDRANELDLNFTAAYHSKASCFEELGDYENAYKTWCETLEWYESRGYEIEAEEPRRRAEECKNKLTDR